MRFWRVSTVGVLVFQLAGVGLLAQDRGATGYPAAGSCDLNNLPDVSEGDALQQAKRDPDAKTDNGLCWWIDASRLGSAEALTRVGWLIYKNAPEKSVLYFNEAALMGWAPAREALSDSYRYGVGVAQNTALAQRWHQTALDGDDTLPPKPIPVSEADAQWDTGKTALGVVAVAALGYLLYEAASSSSSSSSASSSGSRRSSSDPKTAEYERQRNRIVDQDKADREAAETRAQERRDDYDRAKRDDAINQQYQRNLDPGIQ